jgi:hypothetical protein
MNRYLGLRPARHGAICLDEAMIDSAKALGIGVVAV